VSADESLTDGIRRRVRERIGACPTCGAATSGTRPVATAIGVPNTVLWRFLKGGDMTGRNLDKLAAWLESRP
jgi:hypothetical protein